MLTLGVVLYATLWPDPVAADDVMLFPGADKLIHAIMMGGLTGAILFDTRRAGRTLTQRRIATAAVIMIVFSCTDEYLQDAMNLGRGFEVTDILADTAGIIIATFTAPPVVNRIFHHPKSSRP